jgi:hypothetical protein
MLDLSDLAQWFVQHKNELEGASYLATLVGLPILLFTYITNLLTENHRREVGTYDTLETQYVEFQKLAVLHAHLDVADKALTAPKQLTDTELAQQRTLYMVLFSLFERAFLMYRSALGASFLSEMRRQQWNGWVNFIDKYISRESCREAWFNGEPPAKDCCQDFDHRFEAFMWNRMKRNGHVK